jgi:hypothetical protein
MESHRLAANSKVKAASDRKKNSSAGRTVMIVASVKEYFD